MAKPQNIRPSGGFPLVIVGDLLDGSVIVIGVLGQETRILLIGDEQTHPHDKVHDDESVVGLR